MNPEEFAELRADKKVVAVTKDFYVKSQAGRRVFFAGEPVIMLADQYDWMVKNHPGCTLNLTPTLIARAVASL